MHLWCQIRMIVKSFQWQAHPYPNVELFRFLNVNNIFVRHSDLLFYYNWNILREHLLIISFIIFFNIKVPIYKEGLICTRPCTCKNVVCTWLELLTLRWVGAEWIRLFWCIFLYSPAPARTCAHNVLFGHGHVSTGTLNKQYNSMPVDNRNTSHRFKLNNFYQS